MFEIKNLSKQYGTEFALKDITMNIGRGMNFIVGASGSGKTTMLKILSGMEQGFSGSVSYLGKEIESFTKKEKSALYNSVFGFVWQDFHLLEEATVLENVLLPAFLKDPGAQKSAERILKQLKMEDMANQKVKFLSGGQKQRVAIARELMKNPQVLFCDEPTSALDAKSAKVVMDILRSLSKSRTVIVVTHDTSLMSERDAIFELDKGELISASDRQTEAPAARKEPAEPLLGLKNAFRIAFSNMKNKAGRFCISTLSLLLAGALLLTAVSGAVEKSGQGEFEKLVATYGEGILDIGLVGSFMNAAGGDEEKPDGTVNQDLSGLYEAYQEDERVEFIVSMQPFENIQVTLDGKTHAVEKTGNSPVLTKLLSGSIPSGTEYQTVIPVKFAESIGLTPESALGREIDFSATVYQWVNDQPIERPVQIKATVCGVADNTVVYDYEGKPYSFTVDDSFFFNKAAIEEIRTQAGIQDKSANFTIRTKTPADLISLKDELNKKGIVPLGRFELVEDIVRLNQQTKEQSGSAGIVIGVLSVLLAVLVFAMTSVLRRREYAIYKVSGYRNGHLVRIAAAETVFAAGTAIVLLLVIFPVLDKVLAWSAGGLAAGAAGIAVAAVVSFAAGLPAAVTASAASMLKAGDKA